MYPLSPKSRMIHMRNNFIRTLILSLVLPFTCAGSEVVPLSREEMIGILRENMGCDYPGSGDHAAFERYKDLLKAGEASYPALAEELLSSSDDDLIRAILSVFKQSKGDKTIPRRAMRKFIERHGRDNSSSGAVYAVTMALGVIGGAEDADLLKEYLDVKDVLQRHNVENSIERIEKRQQDLKRQAEFDENSRDRRKSLRTGIEPCCHQVEGDDENSRSNRSLAIWIVIAAAFLLAAVVWLRSNRGKHPQ